MKRKLISLFTLMIAVLTAAFCFVACDKEVKPVVITVSESVAADTTLIEYMEEMEAEGDISFTVENGMVTKIGDIANSTNSYWMLYTSDDANANVEWGVYDYEGETLGSATEGAETLIVKAGETYIWVYQTF